MLRQRVITAIVLLLVLASVLASPWQQAWPVFLAVVSGLAVWEWLRMTSRPMPVIGWVGGAAVILGLIWQGMLWQGAVKEPVGLSASQGSQTLFLLSVALSSAVWLMLVPMKLKHADVHSAAGLPVWGLFAPVCLYATWGALVVWMDQGGIWLVISILALVWIADIFAYFGGKRWGRNKLAPAISPGKTREGALVGLNGVIVWMLVTSQIPGSYAEQVLELYGWFLLILIAALLGAVSIMGDLFESLLKRQVGIKDSSNLLPGHGGVFDRIDAVVAVVPLAYLITSPSLFQ
ncbi:phosphatidate cytidylyltransferase [Orrella marina]|uniref:Phosphatidate cytidylyltransferase n=1 Tax=Orrella marina TaxID=2163011 RepID=A0A2R4XHK0_9BURK|nr:phosphatidate cytidylyltransferase [Orrella marina]AWB33223.1 phosphatidate cytidylyltransferase [Orrella marina]